MIHALDNFNYSKNIVNLKLPSAVSFIFTSYKTKKKKKMSSSVSKSFQHQQYVSGTDKAQKVLQKKKKRDCLRQRNFTFWV